MTKMDITQRIREGQKRGNEIFEYWHCRKCRTENLYPNIGVGWTAKGIQIWCENHNENVRHIDLMGQKVAIVEEREVE